MSLEDSERKGTDRPLNHGGAACLDSGWSFRQVEAVTSSPAVLPLQNPSAPVRASSRTRRSAGCECGLLLVEYQADTPTPHPSLTLYSSELIGLPLSRTGACSSSRNWGSWGLLPRLPVSRVSGSLAILRPMELGAHG